MQLNVDRWLFADGDPDRHLLVRRLFAALLLVRILTWRYHDFADLPRELVWHVWYWDWLERMPPVPAMVAIQVVGAVAAVGVLTRRRVNQCFVVAWVAFLALAGLRSGVGKVLHNDALPLIAMVPFLWPGPTARSEPCAPARAGWPLRSAQLLVATIYFLTGVQKLVHSGIEWVTTDNMRWIMEGAARDGVLGAVPEWIASQPILWRTSAVALLGMELLFPLALVHRWPRRLVVTGAVTMHVMTLVTLRLDYLSWAGVVLVLFVDWGALLRRRGDAPAEQRGGGAEPHLPAVTDRRWGEGQVGDWTAASSRR